MNDGWNVVKQNDRVAVVSCTIDVSGKTVLDEGVFQGLKNIKGNDCHGFKGKTYGYVVAFPHIPAAGRGLDKTGVLTLPFHMNEINPTLRDLEGHNIRPRFRFVRRVAAAPAVAA